MALEYGQMKYAEINKNLDRAAEWLAKQGVDIQGNRFSEILKNMLEIARYNDEGRANELASVLGVEIVIASLAESMPFVNIYEAFKSRKPHEGIPKETLKRIVKGSFLSTDESAKNATNEARNHLFELELAAILSKKCAKIISFDDISFDLEGVICNIQCKRAMEIGALSSNIKEAVRQFQARASTEESRGIIAIAVDKILGTDKEIIITPTSKSLEEYVNRKLSNFVRLNMSKWGSITDPRILAVFIYMKYAASVSGAGNGQLSTGRQTLIVSLVAPHIFEGQDYLRIKKLEQILST